MIVPPPRPVPSPRRNFWNIWEVVGSNMHPPHALVLLLLAIALAAFSGEAAAQVYPAPYSYPPADYRGVPVPDDDDDDVVTADPDDGDLPPSRAPLARTAPMPRADSAPYPYDPRIDRPAAPIPEAGLPSERYGGGETVAPVYEDTT